MPTEIKQIRDESAHRTVLRVSGEMFRDDAVLIARIAHEVGRDTSDAVTLDLADLDLLDSEAAHVLRKLADERGFSIEGTEVLIQTAIDEAERHAESN
jgi:anti-anti-sigma regulatory factor